MISRGCHIFILPLRLFFSITRMTKIMPREMEGGGRREREGHRERERHTERKRVRKRETERDRAIY